MNRGPIPRFDLYEELEVSRLASEDVIDAAYRTLVKRYHPDVANVGGALEPVDVDRIKRLNVAHDWLTTPAKRARYDEAMAAFPTPAKPKPNPLEPEPTVGQEPVPASFGPNGAEVRQFLADLRPLDQARALEIGIAKSTVDSTPYAEARGAALAASRRGRHEQWLLARDAATVIARGKLVESPLAREISTIVADIAGAIVVRDLLQPGDYDILTKPWSHRPEAAIEPAADGKRGMGLALAFPADLSTRLSTSLSTGLVAVGAAAGSVVRGTRRSTALGGAGIALVAIIGIALLGAGPRSPLLAVAGPSGSPAATEPIGPPSSESALASVPIAQPSPGATLAPPIESPAPTPVGPTATNQGPLPHPTAGTGPTPGPGATPKVTPKPTPRITPAPTPTPTPTPVPTPSPRVICTVVNLVNVNSSAAIVRWSDAGFTGTVIFVPEANPPYKIAWQSLTVGTDVLCTSDITVMDVAP